MAFLIDTSVFVAIERGRRVPREFLDTVADTPVFLAAITASELLHGVHRADSAVRRARREVFVEAVLASVPLLPFDLEAARIHARVWADLAARGQPMGAHDLQIAAIALAGSLSVLTANVREFDRVEGLAVVRW